MAEEPLLELLLLELVLEVLLVLVVELLEVLLGELAPGDEPAVADSVLVVVAAIVTDEFELESGEPTDSNDDKVEWLPLWR